MDNTKKIKSRRNKTLFLSAGLPIGVLTSIILLLLNGNPIFSLLFGFAGFLVMGFVLFVLTLLFVGVPRSKWVVTVIQFIFLPIISILYGIAFLAVQYIPQGQWQEIEPPPERAVRFVESSNPSVFGSTINIETSSGKIYSYDCVTYEECTWSEGFKTIQEDTYEKCRQQTNLPKSPIPLFLALDTYRAAGCGPDYMIVVEYLLRDDGQIYMWSSFSSAYSTLLGLFLFAVIGFLAGFSSSITTLLLRKKIHKSHDDSFQPKE